MGKTLVIAEKPSVATDIARVLGGCKREKDYLENDDFIVSSAVGHLLEIFPPDGVEVKRGKWNLENLPVIPPNFELRPIEKSEPRLKVLGRLLKKKEVDAVINACDAGREGELIFRYIVQYLKCKKPIQRLWLQSMTPAAIRQAFEKLRSDEAMQPLADAATCRSEADWLVGINGTRAMTAFNSKSGGFQLTTVGRVQTPTLSIVVEREEVIKAFIPRDYWEIHATFGAEAGEYPAKWIDEQFRREKDGDGDLRSDRLWERAKADAITAACTGNPGSVTEESKPSKQLSPLLFDLTSLQREANSRFGFSASNTLKIAQSLYERHKVLTYPRTDSRALPEDYMGTVKKTLEALGGSGYEKFANTILDQNWITPNKRIFNNAKISDHFAIIPTPLTSKKLSEPEQKLYDLVTKRFLAVFYPAAEYRITTRITRVEEHAFKTDGKVLLNPGWLEIYGRSSQSNGDGSSGDLAPVKQDEIVKTLGVEVMDFQTRPPARYTEATLLSAMEGAGKLIDDEDLRAAMTEKGLGTPATRASIIEGLIREKYIARNLKELQPTAKAFSLITLLRALEIHGLSSPELTGDWEHKLKQIEQGSLSRDEFMREIAGMTRELVDKTKQYESDTVPGDFATLRTPCPKCGGVVKENYKKFACQACDWDNWKILAGRQLEVPEMETLLTERAVGPLQGFRSKMGRSFDAALKLNDEHKIEFDFGNDEEEAEVDFSGQEPLGKCPKCAANVYDSPMSYTCENAVGKEKKCDFRTGKIILKRPMEREQVVKLLTNRKTDLLEKFVSKKGRPFKAFLVLDPTGKVGFEFEPKAAKKTASKTAAAEKPAEPPAEE